MDIFNVLTMLGGLCLFLFGMNVMGEALESRAGSSLRSLLGKLTTKKIAGFLTGCGITAVIQSSSATTVMVVGFVNSGLMNLKQAINVIMGANVGTTITGWILSLGGINGTMMITKLLKPESFTPVLAAVGIILYMFCKGSKRKDTGLIFLGFATLMFGMETMSDAVAGLADIPAFQQMFIMFKSPLLGLLAGAVLTAIIQSSSAAVGIVQAFAMSGQISIGAAVPIIMGTAIGTCVTAMLSSVGTNRDAKRAAMAHLLFNVIGSVVWLGIFWILKAIFAPAILDESATILGIAIINTVFKVLSTVIIMPFSQGLERLVCKLLPTTKESHKKTVELDDRLLSTPPLALEQSRIAAAEMGICAVTAMKDALVSFTAYTPELAETIRKNEESTDHYEDIIGAFLIRLSAQKLSENDSEESADILKIIGDFERIADHAVNLLESAEELRSKKLAFSEFASREFTVISAAINEILDLALDAFVNNNLESAKAVEPLEQVIDDLKELMRTRHINRMQRGECSVAAGFVWNDVLTDLERTSDHCSNICGDVIDNAFFHSGGNHVTLRESKFSEEYAVKFDVYQSKYSIE